MITITNNKILKYFNEHKEIDPENSFLLFIEILEKFGDNIFENMSSSLNKQILEGLNENTRALTNLQENVNKMNKEITSSLFIKMIEIKKEYLEDTKSIITVLVLLTLPPIGVVIMWVWTKWKLWMKSKNRCLRRKFRI